MKIQFLICLEDFDGIIHVSGYRRKQASSDDDISRKEGFEENINYEFKKGVCYYVNGSHLYNITNYNGRPILGDDGEADVYKAESVGRRNNWYYGKGIYKDDNSLVSEIMMI